MTTNYLHHVLYFCLKDAVVGRLGGTAGTGNSDRRCIVCPRLQLQVGREINGPGIHHGRCNSSRIELRHMALRFLRVARRRFRARQDPTDRLCFVKAERGHDEEKRAPPTGVSRERATTKAFLFNGIERDDAHAVKWFQFGC